MNFCLHYICVQLLFIKINMEQKVDNFFCTNAGMFEENVALINWPLAREN